MDPISLAIIAADPLARAGLASQFADELEVQVITQRSPLEAESIRSDGAVDVAVWDVGWSGAETMPDLVGLGLPVLVLVSEIEDVAQQLFADSEIAYVHMRSATNNCFQARIERDE